MYLYGSANDSLADWISLMLDESYGLSHKHENASGNQQLNIISVQPSSFSVPPW
jgi:hypothetical protein